MSEPLQALASKETYLAALEREAVALSEATSRIHELAVAARVAGASWSEIGQRVGISRQGAQQRFGHV